jgi:hypothetical protein
MDWAKAFAVDAALPKFTVECSLFFESLICAYQAHDFVPIVVVVIV